MKCTICGRTLDVENEICHSCRDGIRSKDEDIEVLVERHREWAISRLNVIDRRLDFLKKKVLAYKKEKKKLDGCKPKSIDKKLEVSSKALFLINRLIDVMREINMLEDQKFDLLREMKVVGKGKEVRDGK